MQKITKHSLLIVLSLLMVLSSCLSKKMMDARATERIIEIHAEAILLLDKHTEDFSKYKDRVEALERKCLEAYEYEKVRGKSEEAIKIWEVMMDKEKPLLGAFLDRWENDKTKLTDAFIANCKHDIREGFSILTHLMYRRVKDTEIGNARRFIDRHK